MMEFQECQICASKPGAPTLCPSCVNNREIASMLRRLAQACRTRRVGQKWQVIEVLVDRILGDAAEPDDLASLREMLHASDEILKIHDRRLCQLEAKLDEIQCDAAVAVAKDESCAMTTFETLARRIRTLEEQFAALRSLGGRR